MISTFFFFNDTATTEIYTLSLHDALPICFIEGDSPYSASGGFRVKDLQGALDAVDWYAQHGYGQIKIRSEEHTSELQSRSDLVCRLLLEKKKKNKIRICTEFITQTQTYGI